METIQTIAHLFGLLMIPLFVIGIVINNPKIISNAIIGFGVFGLIGLLTIEHTHENRIFVLAYGFNAICGLIEFCKRWCNEIDNI